MFIASLSLKSLFTVLAAINPPMKTPTNDRIRAMWYLSLYTDKKHVTFRIKSTRNMYRTINNSITANRKTSQAMLFDNHIITQGISISRTITAKPFFSFIISVTSNSIRNSQCVIAILYPQTITNQLQI